jgi:acyl carrier protein
MDKNQILDLVIRSAQRVVAESETSYHDKILFNTPLYGGNGIVDSLGLVQLIADLEEELFQITGKQIIIADEKAMSLKISPFRSISSLADYIESRLQESTP